MVGAVVAIDLGAKLAGRDTITAELRRNRSEALIGVLWLAVHVMKEQK